jgi:arsenate reductase (thioredoxin)
LQPCSNHFANPSLARAVSAGTHPAARVHPEVVEVMREVGIDLSSGKPQLLTSELAQRANLLVTMGCGEDCPFIPGLRRADWALQDPKGQSVDRVREIRDEIHERVRALVLAEGWERTKTAVGCRQDLIQTMQNETPPTDAIRRRWAMVRLGLGLIQIMGATMATILLAQTGVNELSLGAVVVTSIATCLSVFLFGDRPGNRASSKFD